MSMLLENCFPHTTHTFILFFFWVLGERERNNTDVPSHWTLKQTLAVELLLPQGWCNQYPYSLTEHILDQLMTWDESDTPSYYCYSEKKYQTRNSFIYEYLHWCIYFTVLHTQHRMRNDRMSVVNWQNAVMASVCGWQYWDFKPSTSACNWVRYVLYTYSKNSRYLCMLPKSSPQYLFPFSRYFKPTRYI
jgi:hypothetical protein